MEVKHLQHPALPMQEGKPPRDGSYVAYVNPGGAWPAAEKMFLHWHGGRWWSPLSAQAYRDHVYGWIGPLPACPLED